MKQRTADEAGHESGQWSSSTGGLEVAQNDVDTGPSFEHLIKGAIDHLPGAVAIIDANNLIIYANEQARRTWKVSSAHIPCNLSEIDDRVARTHWLPTLERKRETNTQQVCYYTLGDQNQRVHAHIAAFLPMPSDHGSAYTLLVDHDVSERVSLEQKVQAQHVAWIEAERLGKFGTFEFAHPDSDVIASAGLLRLLSFDPESEHPTTEQLWQRFTPQSVEVAQRALRSVWEGRGSAKEELVAELPGGESRLILAEARLVKAEEGNSAAIMGYCHDVTEQRRLEQALRTSESRYRSLLEHSTQYLLVVQDQKVVYINPHAAKALGYTVNELAKSHFIEFVHPDDRGMVMQMHERRLHGGYMPERYELRVTHRNGQHSWCEMSGVPFEWEGRPAHLMFATDVTARKQAEEALLQSQRRMRALFDHSLDAVMLIDDDGKYVDVSPSTEQLLERSRDEILQLSMRDLFGPIPEEEAARRRREFLDRGHDTGEVTIEVAPGRTKIFDYKAVANVQPGLHFSVLRDVTKSRQDEEALRESEARYRSIAENFPNGAIFIIDKDLRYTFAAGGSFETVELNPEDVIGKTIWEAFPQSVSEVAVPATRRMLAGEMCRYEVTFRDRVFSNEGVPIFDATGDVTEALVIVQDITERKKAEDALRESEREKSLILNTTAEMFAYYDLDLNIQWANHASGRSVGMSTEELIGRKCYEVWHGRSEPCPDCPVLRARESKQQEQNEVRTPDDRYFHLRGYPVLNEDNEVTGLIEFGQETTDRRRAEEALKESEHRFRSFVENASDIIYSLTPDGVFSYVSPNWKEFFGEPADAVIGKKFDPYIHPDDVQVCQEFLHSVLTGDRGSRTSLEYRVLRADGSVRWHTSTASALFDENGNAVSFVGIARDITEKKRMDQALKESEERFEMAMRGSSDGFWDWPDVTDTSYVWWSPRLFELIGYEPGEIRPSFSFWLESIHPDDQELADRTLQESLSNNAPLDVQYRLRTKSGSYRWFRARGVVLRDDDGQPRRMSGSLVDITETKRLQELESRAQRLETAGSIAGQVAHDFNNLLAPLTAYPDIIKEYLTVDHPAYTYLEDMERAAVQIGEINQQLLTLGRRGHYQQEPLVVNEVVEQILRQMEPLPPTLRVESRLADDLMYIKAGRSQIYRALTNLVNNAREAMQDIGCLSITTENYYVDEQLVNEGSVPRGEYVKLTVSDTGCGIPAKIRSRIFDPFFTTKQADKKRGSGLGISVVDAVVKDHQGFIDLHSVEGEGTSFYLYIPITRETPIGDGSHEVTGGTESILVVDDDEVQREVTRELLTRLGYRVDVAENGEQALQRLAAQSADLLLLDMIMPPGMDGAETYRKALEHAPDQRALLVSGFAESDRVELALNLGASAFVRKPLSRKTLAQAVRKALDTKSA